MLTHYRLWNRVASFYQTVTTDRRFVHHRVIFLWLSAQKKKKGNRFVKSVFRNLSTLNTAIMGPFWPQVGPTSNESVSSNAWPKISTVFVVNRAKLASPVKILFKNRPREVNDTKCFAYKRVSVAL